MSLASRLEGRKAGSTRNKDHFICVKFAEAEFPPPKGLTHYGVAVNDLSSGLHRRRVETLI